MPQKKPPRPLRHQRNLIGVISSQFEIIVQHRWGRFILAWDGSVKPGYAYNVQLANRYAGRNKTVVNKLVRPGFMIWLRRGAGQQKQLVCSRNEIVAVYVEIIGSKTRLELGIAEWPSVGSWQRNPVGDQPVPLRSCTNGTSEQSSSKF